MGGVGAADRAGAATRQDAAQRAAPDHLGGVLAKQQRCQVARHSNRARPVVAGRPAVHPLGKQGVWERLLELAEARMGGPALGMVFLNGTSIRAHQKAAGAQKRGWTANNVSSDIQNPSRGDTENPSTSATVMPRRVPVRVSS